MQKQQYDSIRYVGQELHLALGRLFTKNQYGEIAIQHRDDEAKNESVISYSVYGLEVRLFVSKADKGFHLIAQVGAKGSDHLETRADSDIKIKRSRNGRVSQQCMDDIALQSINYLREFHKKKSDSK